jgi:hypothetical protein
MTIGEERDGVCSSESGKEADIPCDGTVSALTKCMRPPANSSENGDATYADLRTSRLTTTVDAKRWLTFGWLFDIFLDT